MSWLIFTMVSTGVILDVDHKQFKSYTECTQYVEQLKSNKPKSCFTQNAKFKQPKVKKGVKRGAIKHK